MNFLHFLSRAFALLLFLFLTSYDSKSQELNLMKVVVSSSDSTAIPFAHIFIKSSGNGTYSNIGGVFNLTCTSNDMLTISSIGFKEKEVLVKSLVSDTIFLDEEVGQLLEVVVTAKKNKPNFEEIGNHNNKRDGAFIGSNAVALLVENEAQQFAYVNKVYIVLSKNKTVYKGKKPEFHETLIRLRLLKNQNGKITPEENLLSSDQLYRVKEKERNIEFDVSNEQLLFPSSGLFITVEFVGYYKGETFIPFSSDNPNRKIQFKAAFSDEHEKPNSWLKYDHYQKWESFDLGILPHKNFNFGLLLKK